MNLIHRSLGRFAVCAVIVIIASALAFSCPEIAQARHARGGGASSQAGFLAPGHWIASPTGQNLTPIFPLADSVTGATARIHQVYWNGTNDIPYDLAMGDAFGAYPYICTLILGPPGMTVEQSTYTTFQNPDYCRVLWHPQGNISSAWNGEVEIAVTDQQHNTVYMSWALWTVGQYSTSSFSGTATVNGSSTITVNSGSGIVPGMVLTGTCIQAGTYIAFDLSGSGSTGTYAMSTAATCSAGPESVTGSYGQGAVFVSTTGSGSTCTYAAPCTFTTAFGSAVTTSTFPGAICYVSGGSYTGSTNLPAYASGFATASNKPNALIGMPGAAVTLDASAGATLLNVGTSDWYMENVTANGYDSSAVDKLVLLNQQNRLTFDQVNWINSGYGTGASNNMSMFVSGGSQTPGRYLFITDSAESNREGGTPGNNFGFIDLYAWQYALVQRDIENSPGASLDGEFYFKIDETNSELRENYANANAIFGLAGYGSQYAGNGMDEDAYNLMVNMAEIQVGGNSGFTWQGLGIYRNTILSGSGRGLVNAQTTYNLSGPGGPGLINMSGTTGGSLTPGTSYTCGVTSLGNSGESQTIIGSYGRAMIGTVAGTSNQNSLTLPGGDSAITLSWEAEPGAIGYNVYCEVTGSGAWTEYSAGNVTSYAYTGGAGTSASPPSSSTAIVSASTALFSYYANAFATTNATTPPAIGAVIQTTGSGIPNNVVDPSGTSNIICIAAGAGCAAIGQLNTTYSGYPSIEGEVGYQIQ